jgi:hypothetical protein
MCSLSSHWILRASLRYLLPRERLLHVAILGQRRPRTVTGPLSVGLSAAGRDCCCLNFQKLPRSRDHFSLSRQFSDGVILSATISRGGTHDKPGGTGSHYSFSGEGLLGRAPRSFYSQLPDYSPANRPQRLPGIQMLPAIRVVHISGLCFDAPTPSAQANFGIRQVKCSVS